MEKRPFFSSILAKFKNDSEFHKEYCAEPIEKEQLMKEAQLYCDDNDKSTEFMLEYMQSVAGATLDEVLEFLQKQSDDV